GCWVPAAPSTCSSISPALLPTTCSHSNSPCWPQWAHPCCPTTCAGTNCMTAGWYSCCQTGSRRRPSCTRCSRRAGACCPRCGPFWISWAITCPAGDGRRGRRHRIATFFMELYRTSRGRSYARVSARALIRHHLLETIHENRDPGCFACRRPHGLCDRPGRSLRSLWPCRGREPRLLRTWLLRPWLLRTGLLRAVSPKFVI